MLHAQSVCAGSEPQPFQHRTHHNLHIPPCTSLGSNTEEQQSSAAAHAPTRGSCSPASTSMWGYAAACTLSTGLHSERNGRKDVWAGRRENRKKGVRAEACICNACKLPTLLQMVITCKISYNHSTPSQPGCPTPALSGKGGGRRCSDLAPSASRSGATGLLLLQKGGTRSNRQRCSGSDSSKQWQERWPDMFPNGHLPPTQSQSEGSANGRSWSNVQ